MGNLSHFFLSFPFQSFILFIKNQRPATLAITFNQVKLQWPEKRTCDYYAKFVKTDLIQNILFSTQTWSTASSTFVRTKITGIPKSSNCLANQQELDMLFRVKTWKIGLSENYRFSCIKPIEIQKNWSCREKSILIE